MAATNFRTYRLDGFEHIAVENADLRAVFIPELGCKMTEVKNLRTGRTATCSSATAPTSSCPTTA